MNIDLTIAIKTFERYESLGYLLSSISKMKFDFPVVIADDSENRYRDEVLAEYGNLIDKYITLPFDVGQSVGRNVLMENVQTQYVLLCEDDFIFDERTDLYRMLELLESGEIDLLGGMVYNRHKLIQNSDNALVQNLLRLKVRTARDIVLWLIYQNPTLRTRLPVFQKEATWDFFGRFEIREGVCYISRYSESDYSPPYTLCDYVPLFFMADVRVLKERSVIWDDEMPYGGPHMDFFFRAKRRSVRVAITKEAGVIHQRIHNPYYRRGRDDRHIMKRKNGLSRFERVETSQLMNWQSYSDLPPGSSEKNAAWPLRR